MAYKSCTDLSTVLSQFTRVTDRQTEIILIARPRLHSMQRGKSWSKKLLITALHAIQTRSSDDNSVCASVRLSVRLSNAWFVTKWKKDQFRFLYHTKDHLA